MASTQVETSGKSKKNGKASASRRNELGGFLVDKIDGKLMRKYVGDNGLAGKIDTDVTDEQLAVALVLHFKDVVPKEDQVRCDIADGGCGSVSSATEDSCPICGEGGEVEGHEASAAPADGGGSESLIEEVEEDDDEQEEASAVVELDEPEDDGHIPGANDGEDEDEQEEVAAAPPAPKKNAAKKATKEKTMQTQAHTNGSGTKKGAASTALAKASASHVLSTKDLDKRISEVKTLTHEVASSVKEGAEAYWNLGKALLAINADQLWKLRVDENGKSKYKSWDAFVHAELGMSPQTAYAAIDCAKGYDSPDEVAAIGQTKAVKLLQAAPQDRPAIAAAAKAGATVREVTELVNESKKKHGSQKKSQQAKAGSKGGAAKATKTAAARPEKVSVTAMEGVVTVKLYKRPASLKNLDFSELTRAKKIADQPFGRHEMANGLVQTYTLVQKENGELGLKIETRRDEA